MDRQTHRNTIIAAVSQFTLSKGFPDFETYKAYLQANVADWETHNQKDIAVLIYATRADDYVFRYTQSEQDLFDDFGTALGATIYKILNVYSLLNERPTPKAEL